MIDSLTLSANSVVPGSFDDDHHHITPTPEASGLVVVVLLVAFLLVRKTGSYFLQKKLTETAKAIS